MKTYESNEWFIKDGTEREDFDHRIYIDRNKNPITGMLKGFYGYDTSDEAKNSQYVKEGKRF
jgi:hypothetical protein